MQIEEQIIAANNAVYTYTCLRSGHCADTWSNGDLNRVRRMLSDMGFPTSLENNDIKKKFMRLRKGGKIISVLNRNMARKGANQG